MDLGPRRLGKDLKQSGTDPQIALAFGAAALRIAGRVLHQIFQLFAQDANLLSGFWNSRQFNFRQFNLWGHRITSVLTMIDVPGPK